MDEDDAAWIRASAASVGQTLTTQQVDARVEMLGARPLLACVLAVDAGLA